MSNVFRRQRPRYRLAVMQSQIYCGGCRNLLLYQRGALSVRCSICGTISAVVPAVERAQLVCVGCRTVLMYPPGASSVRCSCCHTINDARAAFAQVNCSHCYTTLAYPSGALSVKCAVCQHVTNVGTNTSSVPIPVYRPNGVMPPTSISSTSAAGSVSQNETVVVENPMTMDESGKLVSNVVVGVTTGKK